MAIFNGFSEEKLEEILNGYFNGLFTTRDLPVDVYDASVERISQGLFGGFGGSLDDFEDLSGEKELLKFFDHNVQMFSAAKTFQEAKDITSALFDADGFKRSFSDFKKDAAKITAVYNETWLRTEFDTASNMGLSGRQWLDAERDKEIAPLLKYETVGDERVRPQHVNLDGIVKPVDDPFWNTNYPPNGWNCRCIVEQLFEDEQPITPNEDLPPVDEVPPLFRMNPGKDKFIFNEAKHPFFKVSQADKEFKDQNFGLPVTPKPEEIPKFETAKTVKKAEKNQIEFNKTLSEEEKISLKKYTNFHSFEINGHLRGSDIGPLGETADFLEGIERLDSVITKAPKIEATVFRGLHWNKEAKFKGYLSRLKTDLFVERGFMSTSLSKKVAEAGAFGAGGSNDDKFTVIIELQSKKGAMINLLSGIEDEKEVLFNKGSKFKIKDIINVSDNKVTIKLTDL